jgi:PAS domain S-box-containing protein
MNDRLPPAAPPPVRTGTLDVLLLEDSAFDAELIEVTLHKTFPGVRLAWVKDEQQFGLKLRQQRFDLVLSDYQLPSFSGAEALQLARGLAPETPFIFVSGVIGEENAVELLKSGATDYVIKSRLARLPVAIERALREVRERGARAVAEAQLREADALYARVVDSLHDYAVMLLDPQGAIRQWNRAASTLFGHPLEAMRGRQVDLLFTEEDRAAGLLARELAQARAQGSAGGERWMLRADGRSLRAECVVTPLHSDAGEHTGFSKIVRDVTTAYQASQALRHAKEEAERANELKDQFLAVLSHELRSPLSAITGWAEILARRGQDDPVLSKAGTVIRRNAQLQARLINDLLDITAATAGKLQAVRTPLDLAALVAEVTLSHLHDAQARGVALDRGESAPIAVDGDARRLSQVVSNLVANAIKFTEPGGRVEVRTRADNGRAVLTVRDNGRGIAPEFLPFVFERLRQEDGSSTRRAGGLGLGLAIAKAIVELHDGHISACSDGHGQGACFEMSLPLANGHAVPADGAPSASAENGNLAGVRLLLVDDEADAREVGQVALATLGAQVQAVGSAPEALERLQRERFDVLVSDVGMPGMNGLSLIRAVRQLPHCAAHELAAVALTAFAMSSDRQAGLAAGFQAYVAKPIALLELADAVREALAASRAAAAR